MLLPTNLASGTSVYHRTLAVYQNPFAHVLDYRSLNIDTFDPIYVLMGHALPEEAQSAPVQ